MARFKLFWAADNLDADDQAITANQVFESDEVPTGLLDLNGHPLYRAREPMGYKIRD